MQAASAKPPPLGLCDYPSSRAVYAIDLMLKWDRRPDGKGREGGKHCRAGQGVPRPQSSPHADAHLPAVPAGSRVMQPQILEVNFNPDCERACKYHPTFFNDVFSTLYLDDFECCNVTRLV